MRVVLHVVAEAEGEGGGAVAPEGSTQGPPEGRAAHDHE